MDIVAVEDAVVVGEPDERLGEVPVAQVFDGACLLAAGLLLLTPGYFTDTLGLLLLIPPLRGAIYGFLKSRVQVIATGPSGFRPPGGGPRQTPPGTIDLNDNDWRNR